MGVSVVCYFRDSVIWLMRLKICYSGRATYNHTFKVYVLGPLVPVFESRQ